MTEQRSMFRDVDAITDPLAMNTLREQPVMTFPLLDGRKGTVWWSFNDGTWKGSVT